MWQSQKLWSDCQEFQKKYDTAADQLTEAQGEIAKKDAELCEVKKMLEEAHANDDLPDDLQVQ